MSNSTPLHFTHSTLPYWQIILPSNQTHISSIPPYQYAYPAPLPAGKLSSSSDSVLLLPIRPLPSNPNHAVASLLVNQASFDVVDTLAGLLAEQLTARFLELGLMFGEGGFKGDINDYVVVGLPSLGNTLAPIVARTLGFCKNLSSFLVLWFCCTVSRSCYTIVASIQPGLHSEILSFPLRFKYLTIPSTVHTPRVLAEVLVYAVSIRRRFLHHFSVVPIVSEAHLPRPIPPTVNSK